MGAVLMRSWAMARVAVCETISCAADCRGQSSLVAFSAFSEIHGSTYKCSRDPKPLSIMSIPAPFHQLQSPYSRLPS